jgi:NAD(P)-dependent dehydrogenase (short-subunit alcohol dehydrogenase family)
VSENILSQLTSMVRGLTNSKYPTVKQRSTVDGREYTVRDLPDKQKAADLLAKLRLALGTLMDSLHQSYPDKPQVQRLVNNFRADPSRFLESTPEDWQRIISVDLFGTLNCLHTFLPGMVERGYGRIVCMASDSARIGQARLSYYAAAKSGVIALVKSIAQEVGRSGVTINVVSPGATNTEMRVAREASLLEQMGLEKYERRQKAVLKMYPAGRIGLPEDIANSIVFLSSDEASWITGQVLSVNGGFCMP